MPPGFSHRTGMPNHSRDLSLPKGGTTIAQPFKVGYERARTHLVPNGTADSIPEIMFVVLDAMFPEQRDKFLFEIHLLVMLGLIPDVLNYIVQLGKTDAE